MKVSPALAKWCRKKQFFNITMNKSPSLAKYLFNVIACSRMHLSLPSRIITSGGQEDTLVLVSKHWAFFGYIDLIFSPDLPPPSFIPPITQLWDSASDFMNGRVYRNRRQHVGHAGEQCFLIARSL